MTEAVVMKMLSNTASIVNTSRKVSCDNHNYNDHNILVVKKLEHCQRLAEGQDCQDNHDCQGNDDCQDYHDCQEGYHHFQCLSEGEMQMNVIQRKFSKK